MSWTRGKSPGWAAFDLKQREKLGLKPDLDNKAEAYLQTPCSLRSQPPYENVAVNNDLSTRSFTSVFPQFSSSLENKIHQKPTEVGCFSHRNDAELVVKGKYHIQTFKRLKELHHWAESSLIEDIMTAVDNDFNKASDILNELALSGSVKNIKKSDVAQMNSNSEGCPDHDSALYRDENVILEEIIEELRFVLEDCPSGKNERNTSECLPHEKILSDEADCTTLILEQLRSLPVEPECEQDDVYLNRRKDAIRMIRLASQHSKAATNAYARGDHASAKQFSLMARKEWTSAKMLHAKAAKEILSVKNSKDDLWKLDLHGLHAAEAVEALKEHLYIIEALVTLNQSVSPSTDEVNARNAGAFSAESYGFIDMEKFDKQQLLSKQRPRLLEVITGRGKHSRGRAALPTAIRAFLDGNSYRYDEEARPGVIMVRPKFRQV